MKKMLFVIVALFCATHIVKADGPKGHGFLKPTLRGALEPAEFKTGMKVLFTKGATSSQMAEYFQVIEGFSFENMKIVYKNHIEKTFGVENVTDEEMLDIIEHTSFREAEKGHWDSHQSMYIPRGAKTYGDMEWWNPSQVRNNEFIGTVTLGGQSKDWVTTFCANPDRERRVERTVSSPTPPIITKGKTEYIFIPGKTTVIEHGADSVIESFTHYREVQTQNNSVMNTVSKSYGQSFDLDMGATTSSFVSNPGTNNCSCQPVVQRQSCGCDQSNICQNHYNQYREELVKARPKERKKFFDRFIGKVIIFGAGVAAGLFIDDINLGGHHTVVGQTVTQGPLVLLNTSPSSIYTQAPLSGFN